MIKVKGDLFEYIKENPADIICCTTNMIVKSNGELVMGAGIAKAFRDRYPGLARDFGSYVLQNQKAAFSEYHTGVFLTEHDKQLIAYFPTKTDWKLPSILSLIEKSLGELIIVTNYNHCRRVVLPRPGCSNGGLDWETQVKPLCEKYLDDRFVVISL